MSLRGKSLLGVFLGAVFFLAAAWSPASALPVVTATITSVGTPQQVVVSPNKPLVYSVGINEGKVYVSSAATNTVIDSISVGSLPCDLVSTPDGKRLYVTNHSSNTVSVIDTDASSGTYNTVVDTIAGFSGPFGIVASPDGEFVYVVNKLADAISIIDSDPTSQTYNTVLGGVATGLTGAEPYWMALNPAGTRMYVTNSLANKVTVINATTLAVIKQIDVGGYPFGVAVTPDGKNVYVANSTGASISVIATVTDTVTETINTTSGDGPVMIAVAPDGSAAYVTLSGVDELSVIDTATNTEKGTVAVGDVPYGVAVTPASPATVGTPIYVANFNSGTLSVIQFTPNPPTSVQATAGDKKLDVSWTAPAYEGDDTITKYTATTSPDDKTCESNTGTPVTPSCTITGLTNGKAYTVTVVATSDIGDSAASAPSASATPVGPPDKPTSVQLVAGDEELDVEWTAPTDTGGTAIMTYTATTSPDGKTCESKTGTPVTPSCTITGLTNGKAYTVTVVATNAQGDSAPSSASSPATPATVPDAPTSVQATPGDKELAVQWTAPADNGGAPITKYRATTSPDGHWCESTTGSPVTPSCTITGLTNGKAYTVTVVAVNFLGDGAVSAPSAPATPVGPPDAPTAVQVTAGDEELAVDWTAPADTGGTAITKYTATASPEGKTCESTTGTPVTPSCTIRGLTNGTEYTITVVATNAQGASPASASSTGTPVGPPKAPRDVQVTRGDKKLDVKWTAPVNDGGLPIIGYTATTSPVGASCVTNGETSCIIEGLINGTEYTVTVIATNDLGDGPTSDASKPGTPATVPDAPTGVTASAGDAQINVQWAASASNGGSAITGYTATASPGGKTCKTTGATSCRINGLTNGTAYTITVVATNGVGDSMPSEAVGPVTPRSSTKKVQRPIDDNGRPPAFIKTSGLTVITGRNARTNADELIRTRVSGSSMAQGEVRYYRVIRGPQGKVWIRTYGTPGLKIVVVQYAPGTDTHYPYRKRSVYVDGVKTR